MTADLITARQLADAADKAAEGATEGPWEINPFNSVCAQIDGKYHAVCTDQFCYAPEKEANARFIAASRQMVPDLAATIRALCDEVERLREDITTLVRTSAQVAREVFSGSCDHTHQAIDYMEQVARAAAEADNCRRAVASIMGDEG